MRKTFLLLHFFCATLIFFFPIPHSYAASVENPEEWITIPCGGKAAFMGINGGTMPISLLISDDGARLVTFVGRTGNDFMDVVRRVNFPLPSFSNSTAPRDTRLSSLYPTLAAGNSTASMPVVALPANYLAQQEWLEQLEPFGLSEEPLSIEGEVSPPTPLIRNKKYRVFFLSDYFQLRSGATR